MTFFSLMRITTLLQGAINLVTQFVRIAFRVLSDYVYNQVELFLSNFSIKRPKDIYNNQEFASRIRCYMVEYIQNLDTILANL